MPDDPIGVRRYVLGREQRAQYGGGMRLQDFSDHRAVLSPDGECATDGLRSVSWLEMSRWSNQVAGFLADSLAPGERFGVLARNSLEWLALYLGACKAGVVIVPLNVRLKPQEWAYILSDAGVRLVIVDEELREPLSSALPTGVTERVVLGSGVTGWSAFDDVVAARPASPP
ncbi:MAG: AMP-binding protein, partial [Candidatus Dormibacteria bacterium]